MKHETSIQLKIFFKEHKKKCKKINNKIKSEIRDLAYFQQIVSENEELSIDLLERTTNLYNSVINNSYLNNF